jgi:hypothetical protein
MFLEAHFGDVTVPNTGEEEDWLVMDVKVDDVVARVDLISMVRLPFHRLSERLISVARRLRVGGLALKSGECNGNGFGHYEASVKGFHGKWSRYVEDGDSIEVHVPVEHIIMAHGLLLDSSKNTTLVYMFSDPARRDNLRFLDRKLLA